MYYSSLLSALRLIEDRRIGPHKYYPLDYLLLIVFTSTISGCSSWYEIEDYALDWKEDLRDLYFNLTGNELAHTTPSHDSLNRAIGMLDPNEFQQAYTSWLNTFVLGTSGKHIALDGKSMRGVRKLSFDSDSHTVTAYSPKDMAAIAQVYVPRKDNEITALNVLLEQLDLSDTLVTIDAMGTHISIAETIVKKSGHYVLPIKNNQPHSKQEVQDYFCPLFRKHIQIDEQTEIGHGRIETRRCESILNPLELDPSKILTRWSGLTSIHKVTRKQIEKKTGKSSEEVVYYISSSNDLPRIRQAIREHWCIENKLHYCLDVFMLQDQSHKVQGNAPQNMDIILKTNLYILQRLKQERKSSIPRMLKVLSRMAPSDIVKL